MDNLIKFLKKVFGNEEITDAQVEAVNKMEQARADSVSEAMAEIEKYRDDMPEKYEAAIATLAKLATIDPITLDADPENVVDILTDVEKAGARLSKATISQLKKAAEIIGNLITDAEKNVSKGHDGLPDDVKADLEELARLRTEKREAAKNKADAEKQALLDKIEKMEKQIKDLQKGGSKQAKDGDDDDKKANVKKDETPAWPSITGAEDE